MSWTCPNCHRQFAHNRQGHECAPAMTLAEYFSTGPTFERPIFDAVMTHLRTLGEPFLEPVSVGIFVKQDGVSVLQLRPMTKWVALCLFMPRTVVDGRVSRKPIPSGRTTYTVVNVRSPDDVDDVIRGWVRLAPSRVVRPLGWSMSTALLCHHIHRDARRRPMNGTIPNAYPPIVWIS